MREASRASVYVLQVAIDMRGGQLEGFLFFFFFLVELARISTKDRILPDLRPNWLVIMAQGTSNALLAYIDMEQTGIDVGSIMLELPHKPA